MPPDLRTLRVQSNLLHRKYCLVMPRYFSEDTLFLKNTAGRQIPFTEKVHILQCELMQL